MLLAEQDIVARRAAEIEHEIARTAGASWPDRARAAEGQLVGIHGDWWVRHAEDPGGFERRIDELNALARWRHPQLSSIARHGRTYLTPPKFFGGRPTALDETFVLAFTLNHATPETLDYLAELNDLQAPEACLRAHRDYFRQPYAYGRFFKRRDTLLRGYLRGRSEPIPALDWTRMNERYSLYLERCPTISPEFAEPETRWERLEAEVFEIALNKLAHRAALGILRPRVVLLAGQDAWGLLPRDPRQAEDVSRQVRADQSMPCPVTLERLNLGSAGSSTLVVRCNFLGKPYGPNSDQEITRLGEIMGAAAVAGGGAKARSLPPGVTVRKRGATGST